VNTVNNYHIKHGIRTIKLQLVKYDMRSGWKLPVMWSVS